MRFFNLKTVTTMNKIKNDLLAVTQNIFYPDKDFQAFVSQNSTPGNIYIPNHSLMPNSETYSFIVDWQLPGMGMGNISKSFSY